MQNVQVKWLESGKPTLEGLPDRSIDISLSHDDWVCLCAAGEHPQGCDIVPVRQHNWQDWVALLSDQREALLQQLTANGFDSLNRAGTRIWAAIEALRKATNVQQIELSIDRQAEDSVLFRGTAADQTLSILTFPLALTRGLERIVAVVVSQAAVPLSSSLPALEQDEGLLASSPLPDAETLYSLKFSTQPQQPFCLRFPIVYKETSNLSQTVYFSNFFAWMGRVRDLAILPIRQPLSNYLATGEWGMVTNQAQTQIVGEAGLNDVIEVRFWVARVFGPANSTVEFQFDWLKVLPHQKYERIASSQMCMTWVHLPSNGYPQPKPLPPFLADFIDRLHLSNSSSEQSNLPPLSSPTDTRLGNEWYRIPASPIAGLPLREQQFDTSLEDTDAIGNINFASYTQLEGRIRDQFFYSLIPDGYRRTGSVGEFRCINSRIEYLREAFPFEPIHVTLSLKAAYEQGISFACEFFRVMPNGDKQKVAVSQHDAIWFVRNSQGKSIPAAIPTVIRSALSETIALFGE